MTLISDQERKHRSAATRSWSSWRPSSAASCPSTKIDEDRMPKLKEPIWMAIYGNIRHTEDMTVILQMHRYLDIPMLPLPAAGHETTGTAAQTPSAPSTPTNRPLTDPTAQQAGKTKKVKTQVRFPFTEAHSRLIATMSDTKHRRTAFKQLYDELLFLSHNKSIARAQLISQFATNPAGMTVAVRNLNQRGSLCGFPNDIVEEGEGTLKLRASVRSPIMVHLKQVADQATADHESWEAKLRATMARLTKSPRRKEILAILRELVDHTSSITKIRQASRVSNLSVGKLFSSIQNAAVESGIPRELVYNKLNETEVMLSRVFRSGLLKVAPRLRTQ